MTAAALDESGRLSAALLTLDLAKPPAAHGKVQGDRLTSGQRQRMLDAPGVDTHKGRHDTALLALPHVAFGYDVLPSQCGAVMLYHKSKRGV